MDQEWAVYLKNACALRLTAIPFNEASGFVVLWLGGAVWGACVKNWGSWINPKLLCVAVKQTH